MTGTGGLGDGGGSARIWGVYGFSSAPRLVRLGRRARWILERLRRPHRVLSGEMLPFSPPCWHCNSLSVADLIITFQSLGIFDFFFLSLFLPNPHRSLDSTVKPRPGCWSQNSASGGYLMHSMDTFFFVVCLFFAVAEFEINECSALPVENAFSFCGAFVCLFVCFVWC